MASGRAKQPSGPPAIPERAKQPSGPVPTVPSARAKQPSGSSPVAPPPTPPRVPAGAAAALRGADADGRTKRATDSAPLGTPTMAIPVVSAPDDLPLTMRSIELSRAASEGVSDPIAAVRLPPPRKREPADMAALVSTPLSRGSDDLPLGEFHYPTKKNGKAGWILALLAMAALGFGAVVLIVPRLTSQGSASEQAAPPSTPPVPEPAKVVAVEAIDAQLAAEVTPDPEPVVEPEVVPTPTPPTGKTTGSTKTKVPKQTTPPTGTNVVKAGQGSGSAVEEVPDPEPPVSPPITDSDCDEVACVLAKYNRPCCEKYRPASSDLKPRTAGGVPTELDKAAVRSAIEKVKPAVVACGEKNSEKGTVKIAMTVKPDGSVSDASVAASPDDALGSCVASALRKAQFAKTVNGGSFTYPFVF
jgi:TonB family protein